MIFLEGKEKCLKIVVLIIAQYHGARNFDWLILIFAHFWPFARNYAKISTNIRYFVILWKSNLIRETNYFLRIYSDSFRVNCACVEWSSSTKFIQSFRDCLKNCPAVLRYPLPAAQWLSYSHIKLRITSSNPLGVEIFYCPVRSFALRSRSRELH